MGRGPAEHDHGGEGGQSTRGRLEPEHPSPSATLAESDGVGPPRLGLG